MKDGLKNGFRRIKSFFLRDYTFYDLIIVLLFFMIFINYFLNAIITPIYISNTDPITYNQQAIHFSKTLKFTDDYWPMGFSFFLGIFYSIFGPNYAIFKMFNILMLIGLLILIKILLDKNKIFRLKEKNIFFIIFLVFILMDPELLFYSSTLYKEITFIFLVVLSMYISVNISDFTGIFRNIIFGVILAVSGMIASEMIAWFLAPLFLGIIIHLIRLKFEFSERSKGFSFVKKVFLQFFSSLKYSLKKHSVFLISFTFSFVALCFLFSSIYLNSTGNAHIFSTSGQRLVFVNNAPTGCEGVTFTIDNNACVPNDSFLVDYAWKKGLNYSSMNSFQKDNIKKEYAAQFILTHPLNTIKRIIPFMTLWIFPSTNWSQRIIVDEAALNRYLWFTFIIAVAGLILAFSRKSFEKKGIWLWVLIFYAFCTFSYMMTYYLMRYRIYFRIFELLFAAFTIYFILIDILKFDSIFKKISFTIKPVYFLVLILLGLIASSVFFAPYFKIRSETSYNLLVSGIRGDLKLDANFNPGVASSFGLNITQACVDNYLSVKPGNSVHYGLVENYPGGYILRSNEDLKYLLVSRFMTYNVAVAGDITELARGKTDGPVVVNAMVNNQLVQVPLTILEGKILSPDFVPYYLNSCR